MYAGTNRAGFQKDPVTLRDNTNGGGFDVRVTFSTVSVTPPLVWTVTQCHRDIDIRYIRTRDLCYDATRRSGSGLAQVAQLTRV